MPTRPPVRTIPTVSTGLGIARYLLIDVEQDRCGLLYERPFGIA
jgi:hypothetical protein